MKAMVIASAQTMGGTFRGQVLSAYPNQYSGYGRVQLDQARAP
mgnify:FL=1